MLRPNSFGFFLSLLFHGILLLIPFSMVVSSHFKEIELLVLDNTIKPETETKKPKPTPTPLPKKTLIQPEPQTQPQPVVDPEPQLIEPSVPTTKHEAPVLLPPPKPTPDIPKVVTTPPPQAKPLLDVEFGSPNAPVFVHREMPVYPLIARRLGKEGRVVLRLTIDEKGKLLNVEVIEDPGFGFAESAVEAVKKSTFKPAMQEGKPVLSKALLPIRFSLRRD